ncbi:MAG: two-component system response regulator, partial [Rhodocyclaceae bacterium]
EASSGNVSEHRVTPPMLQPGMKLARDFVTREGVLLLSADHVLSPGLIRQIQDYARAEGEQITLYVR